MLAYRVVSTIALATGFALLPMTGVVAIASYLSGKMTHVTGPKWPIVIGLAVGTLGFLSLLILKEQSPAYWVLILPLAALGFGIAYTMPLFWLFTQFLATALHGFWALNSSRQVGSLLGVAIFGTLASTGKFMQGMHSSLIIASLIFLSGCIMTL